MILEIMYFLYVNIYVVCRSSLLLIDETLFQRQTRKLVVNIYLSGKILSRFPEFRYKYNTRTDKTLRCTFVHNHTAISLVWLISASFSNI